MFVKVTSEVCVLVTVTMAGSRHLSRQPVSDQLNRLSCELYTLYKLYSSDLEVTGGCEETPPTSHMIIIRTLPGSLGGGERGNIYTM